MSLIVMIARYCEPNHPHEQTKTVMTHHRSRAKHSAILLLPRAGELGAKRSLHFNDNLFTLCKHP